MTGKKTATRKTTARMTKLDAELTVNEDTATGRRGACRTRESGANADGIWNQGQGMNGSSPKAAK